MADRSDRADPAASARRLVELAGLGFLLGAGGLLALVVAGRTAVGASELVFSVAALVFGFGLTAWAGTILLGESLVAVHERLEVDTDWTPADSRQAMAVLTALGGGAMAGAVVALALLGGG